MSVIKLSVRNSQTGAVMGPVSSCARTWKAALSLPKNSVITNPAAGHREVKSSTHYTINLSGTV